MENSPANQLPEVDSLPDGFVESSAEPLTPRTPTLDQEKQQADYKDMLLKLDRSNDSTKHESSSSAADSSAANEIPLADTRGDKVEKLRTFPVPLSDYEEVENKGCPEVGESGLVTPEPAINDSESSSTVPECDKYIAGSAHGNEHVEGDGDLQGSEKGLLKPQDGNLKETSVAESNETQRNRKLVTFETKRKNAKRSLKSDKELLEFTMKYQQVVAERDAAIAVRDKLESLCRELQRQNKMLMDECKRVSTEGQNMRLDLSTKFHDAIKDVSNKLEQQKDECLSQFKDNEMLRNKLKQLADQYAVSEQQFTQKLKQKTLELQLADLKLQQHEEKLAQEQSQMKLYAEQVSQLLSTEKNLRLQLAADGEKFQQFQDALMKSNEVFETFKQEIEKMAKSIKELKKENVFLKSKCEKSDFTLIELVEEREQFKKQIEKLKNQKEKLESLCRSLQAERKQTSVGSNNSDIPT
ncbi:PREDICTED: alpha-taxilin isoform X2 [Nelumbo nucifera]|uniref:Alpha-taxilin isoform X2 n=1 Tax=Nelumbo nucifera TaxID=4432 RepID=A0A1U7ZY56_NELNU|nr:PREDICTED: alpha-taxilin isoform X2 [Nelumbo nucifera]